MFKRTNGWQRIGIIMSALWILSISGLALTEFFFIKHPTRCMFVYNSIPVGTTWTEKFDSTGKAIKPWEYDWENDDTVTKTRTLRAGLFIGVLIIPVIAAWILSITTVLTFRWIRDGFSYT